MVDISKRTQAEQAIIAHQERLRSLINSTPDIICFKDGAGRWLEANRTNLELFSLTEVDYHLNFAQKVWVSIRLVQNQAVSNRQNSTFPSKYANHWHFHEYLTTRPA